MRSLCSFVKKECLEQWRSGKLIFLFILFMLFGIMNPAIAKLTPWLFEMSADSFAQSGITFGEINVSAMDSWIQYYKNMPMALVVYVLMESSIFTKEYQTGTLVLSLTKGLERYKVVLSKMVVLVAFWTVGYFVCYGITYGYNAYFWDNSVAQNLMFSSVCGWLLGLWIIALLVFFSTVVNSNSAVLVGTAGVFALSYIGGLFAKIREYMPTQLMDGTSLIYGKADADDYIASMTVTIIMTIVLFAASVPVFNRRQV